VGLIFIPILIFAIQVVLGTILDLIPGLQNALNKSDGNGVVTVTGYVTAAIYFPFLLAVTIYLLILIKQRSNDITSKGLFLGLLAFVSIVGIPILAVIPGKKKENKYGSPARAGIHLIH
jgi:uncharacterized membrane protein YhaH (DUF805 family)